MGSRSAERPAASNRTPYRRLLVAWALTGLVACAQADEPAGAAHAPDPAAGDDASFELFERDIIPLLETRCGAGCHATSARSYRDFMRDPEHTVAFYFPVDPDTGRVPADPELRRMAFDVTRGVWRPDDALPHDAHAGGGSHRVDFTAAADYAHLLRAPLAESWGGVPHRGIDVFATTLDPGYQALHAWVSLDLTYHAQETPTPSRAEAFFRDEIIPLYERNGCFLASCHGPDVFNDLKLVPPLPRLDHSPGAPARLSASMVHRNRMMSLGKVSRLVNLGGDLERSRLLLKNLPIAAGGVHQRGGNIQFFEDLDDPDVKTLLAWMDLERRELTAELRAGGAPVAPQDLGRLQGVAFLQLPRHAPRRFFDLETFWPGGRLLVLPEGAAQPHDLLEIEQVEIQGFDVRYDGRAIVLSMRTRPGEGWRLYEVELDDRQRAVHGSLRPISTGPGQLPDGRPVHDVDPIYIAGPEDPTGMTLDDVSITFASNRSGEWAPSDTWALLGEADGGTPDVLVDLQRAEAPGTLTGRRLHIVGGPLEGAWRTIAAHEAGGRLVLDAPLDDAPDARTLYVVEQLEADPRPALDVWQAVPSRFGESLRRVTFTPGQERRPSRRTTGETMFTSVRNRGWQGGRPVFNGAIYRVHQGGFDYHIQGGNRSRYPLLLDSRELPSGLEVRAAQDPRNLWGGGLLLLVDHGFGVNIEPDNPYDHIAYRSSDPRPTGASARFLPAQLPFEPELGPRAVTVTGLSPGGSYRDPFPLPDGTLLVSRAPGPLDHLDPDADPDWDLYRLRFDGPLQAEDAMSVAPFQLDPLDAANTEDRAEVLPRPILLRLPERARTHQKFAPRTDGLAPKDVDGTLRMPPGTDAEIECYDYPLLQSFLTSFAPVGERHLRDGDLAWVRIVQQLPVTEADLRPADPSDGPDRDPFATPVSLGVHQRQLVLSEIPIEPDGSFYARVPPEVPLLVQGLDADRMAVHSMSRWFYLHPGEKLTFSIPRSIFPLRCAGCHGSLTGDRADALGAPDVVSAASRVIATWDPVLGARRAPQPPAPVAVDFRRDVQPILDRSCVPCHAATDEAGVGLDLRDLPSLRDGPWSRAYTSLHALEDPASGDHSRKRYLDERQGLSTRSYLIEKLTGRELEAPRALDTPGRPHPEPGSRVAPLTPDELLTLTRWIDLGATFLGAPLAAAAATAEEATP